jgi:TolA-binding protein
MDCEKFEAAMMDELYGELDELTSAAAKRHVAGCARCAGLLGGLRATRRLATVPLVDPPADLEDRILSAVREAQKVVPVRGRFARVISLAGSWAMRPQTAMAALFLVMIGTSVLLLRGKSARSPASAEVTVTEQGAPAMEPASSSTAAPESKGAMAMASAVVVTRAAEKPPTAAPPGDLPLEEQQRTGHLKTAPGKDKEDDLVSQALNAAAPAGAPGALPAPTATAALGPAGGFGGSAGAAAQAAPSPAPPPQAGDTHSLSPFDGALQAYRAGRFDDATRSFDALSAGDPNADLWAARSVRESKGCRNAVARFDKVAQRARGTPPGWDALLEGALCYRAIGDVNNARVRLNALLTVDSHKDRARAELDRINQLQQQQGATTPPAAAAKPSPKRAAPNAVDQAAY